MLTCTIKVLYYFIFFILLFIIIYFVQKILMFSLQLPQAHLLLHGQPSPGAAADHPGAHGDGHHEVWGPGCAGRILVRVRGQPVVLVLR